MRDHPAALITPVERMELVKFYPVQFHRVYIVHKNALIPKI